MVRFGLPAAPAGRLRVVTHSRHTQSGDFSGCRAADIPCADVAPRSRGGYERDEGHPHANTEGMDNCRRGRRARACGAGDGARPGAGMTFVVGSLTVPGVSTGLVLQDGQQFTVTATGAMCPWGTAYCVGPDGNASWDTTDSWYGGYLLPGAPAWGLVGRVGNGPWVTSAAGRRRSRGRASSHSRRTTTCFPTTRTISL